MRPLVASGLALALALSTLAPAPVLAQEPPPADDGAARADALFEEGRTLMASGDNEAACAKLEESQAMRPGIGTLFNLAECHEKIGKLVLAYREYTEVAERTKVALQADREKIARERLVALEARVARVIISVPDDRKDAKVQLDGQELPPAAWNVAQPVEPGEHTIKAQYGKKKAYEQTFTAAAGDEPITITIGEEGSSSSGGKRNTGLIVTGSILMGVGLVGVGIAAAGADGNGLNAGQWISGISGLACIGVGVPLFVIGLKKKPAEGSAAASLDPLESIEPGPVPAIGIGPASASAAWRF